MEGAASIQPTCNTASHCINSLHGEKLSGRCAWMLGVVPHQPAAIISSDITSPVSLFTHENKYQCPSHLNIKSTFHNYCDERDPSSFIKETAAPPF